MVVVKCPYPLGFLSLSHDDSPLMSRTSAGVLKPFHRALGPYSSAVSASTH